MLIAFLIILLLLILAAVIYVFLVMPRATFAADMELVSTDYAHRGLWGGAFPENSLPAFENAVKNRYGIELDIHLSSDGEVMVFHDDNLLRLCGINKRICEMSSVELEKTRLCGSTYTIPTLRRVLDLVDGAVPLLIEIKGNVLNEELCLRLSELLDNYSGSFCVQAFNPQVLKWFKNHRPRYARGQLVGGIKHMRREIGFVKSFLLSHMLTNVMSRPDFISIAGGDINNLGFILATRIFKARGFVWTVRNYRNYRYVRSKGYFAIFEKICP